MAGHGRRGPGRLLSLAVAIFAFAAVVGFATQASAVSIGIDDETLTIDVGGEVFSEKCDPCHANIADTGNYAQEIIFSHGYHQLIACNGCHTRFPHRPEGTETPKMQGCFACHGLNHGPMGELATGECEDCHNTPEERLYPSFHTRDWELEPHVAPGERQLQTLCMMCHDQAWCDDCHDDEFIVWEPEVPFEYESDGGCLACHGDENLTKTSEGRPKSFQVLGVDDSAHRDTTCQQCHQDYRYDDKIMPTPLWYVNAGFACASCHEAEDPESMVVADWENSVHGMEVADKNYDSATCSSCHGGHYIRRLDTPAAEAALHASAYRVCARCHLEEYNSYDDYYHGAAYKTGAGDAPACWDCHGAHDILPSADEDSMMSDERKPETCGQEGCHGGSGDSFVEDAGSLIHQKIEARESNPLRRFFSGIRNWFN